MASKDGDRSKFFPAIEKKHGEKVSFWITRLKELETTKYPEQIAYLKENYGFSQAHANALVMYVRGSTTSKRFDSPTTFFNGLEPQTRKTVKAIFAAITGKNHITINPFSVDALEKNTKKLAPFKVNKYTFQVPLDWKVDAALISSLAKVRIAEIKPQKG